MNEHTIAVGTSTRPQIEGAVLFHATEYVFAQFGGRTPGFYYERKPAAHVSDVAVYRFGQISRDETRNFRVTFGRPNVAMRMHDCGTHVVIADCTWGLNALASSDLPKDFQGYDMDQFAYHLLRCIRRFR